MNKPRFVFDANVIVSAFLFKNSPPRLALETAKNQGIIILSEAELAGQRVRLTILPDKSTNSSTTETLDQKLKGRVGKVHFQPSDLSERVGEAFTALLDVKD